ncbi:MAG: hypothetical protein ACRYGR_05285 [Janthinobacterium lividum]
MTKQKIDDEIRNLIQQTLKLSRSYDLTTTHQIIPAAPNISLIPKTEFDLDQEE